MTVKIGDRIPDVIFKHMVDGKLTSITTTDVFAGKTVVLFGLSGAFTPICSSRQLPGFIEKADTLFSKGVDEIICISVNDAFVMAAWGKDQEVNGKVMMLADGNAEFSKKLGLDIDASELGFGTRSSRYALLIRDCVVEQVQIEKNVDTLEVSTAENMLTFL